MTGVVQDSTGVETGKIDKIDVASNKATIYFNTQGFAVNLELSKKDEDEVSGSLMGMFNTEGKRLKQ